MRREYTTSRYPIPNKTFDALKDKANKVKLAKGSATLAKDSGKKEEGPIIDAEVVDEKK